MLFFISSAISGVEDKHKDEYVETCRYNNFNLIEIKIHCIGIV